MNHRHDLAALQAAALRAADPYRAVRQFFQAHPEHLHSAGRSAIVALGKASLAMARAALDALARPAPAVIAHPAQLPPGEGWPAATRFFPAGHPLPDAESLKAAAAAAELCKNGRAEDLLLVLVSGGGSALFESPKAGVELADLRGLTDALLKSGADIRELNTVRRALSSVKGGGLARLAFPARVVTLILSDVVGDAPSDVASGPTIESETDEADALLVLDRYRLTRVYPRIATNLHNAARAVELELGRNTTVVVASNANALRAVRDEAQARGFEVVLTTKPLDGEARAAGRTVGRIARGIRESKLPVAPPACVLWGGETTVTVRGDGRGGRNQELALAAAIALENCAATALLTLATDGIDGPTDAAGAIVTGETVRRANALGLSAAALLNDNDSNRFFEALGDLVRTGPTGTNVNDLTIALVY